MPRDDHDYQTCDDPDCERFPCRVFKEGHSLGWYRGHGAGVAEAYPAGFTDGFEAGARSAAASK